MLLKIDVDAMTIKKIEDLIEEGKYIDLRQFINVAILNQIEEEFSDNQLEFKTNSDNFSQIQISSNKKLVLEKMLRTRQKLPFDLANTFSSVSSGWHKKLEEIIVDKSTMEPRSSELIWNFYNRFFPVKVVIHQLAKIIAIQQKKWIELGEIQQQGFDFAERIAAELKEFESNEKLPRNKKLSTGLPTPKMELIGLHGISKRKKEEKLHSGKRRFIEQIIGNITNDQRVFSGACFKLGLMGIKCDDGICYISLTEIGKQFAMLKNPILDKETLKISFSDPEIRFIFRKIYPKFRLEIEIVHKIVDWLKKEKLTSNQLDQLFKDANRKYFAKERIATMGRLSELQIVDWKIDKQGKSQYTLNQEKLSLLN